MDKTVYYLVDGNLGIQSSQRLYSYVLLLVVVKIWLEYLSHIGHNIFLRLQTILHHRFKLYIAQFVIGPTSQIHPSQVDPLFPFEIHNISV